MNLLHDKQLFIKVPFQSTNFSKKKLCADNIKTIGDVYCSTCRNEKCVYISTNKTTSYYDSKRCKACCQNFKSPFKDQKPAIMLIGGDGTHFHESRLRKAISIFEKNSPPIAVTRTKKGQIESKYGINLFASYWLMI